jgi:porin
MNHGRNKEGMTMNARANLAKAVAPAALVIGLITSMPLCAAPYAVPSTWGGDLSTRPRLTGNWGGVRDDLAKRGVVFDVDGYWTPQTITSGGKNSSGGNWGNVNATLNIDTGKAGWWPGGFFKIQTVSSFGHSIYRDTGALVPANEAWALPSLQSDTGLQEFSYLQFLSPKFGLIAGKLDLSVMPGEFHGDYRTGFANTGLNLPLASALVPLSAFGAGVIYVPSHEVHLSAMLLDPKGTIMENDLGKAFDGGVMAVLSGDLKTKLFGLPGHQNLLLSWSNKERASLVQDPSNIARLLLTEKFPRLGDPGPLLEEILAAKAPGLLVPTQPLKKENDTWAAVYSFEQYLWQPRQADPNRGIGMFFSFGVSDGRANPIRNSYNLGFVGKGVVPGRANDHFGVGWSRVVFSDNFVPYMRDTFQLGLDHEDALELYYSAAITPWLSVSPSLQVLRPGLKKTLDASGNFRNLDTAYMVGVRVGVRF